MCQIVLIPGGPKHDNGWSHAQGGYRHTGYQHPVRSKQAQLCPKLVHRGWIFKKKLFDANYHEQSRIFF